MSIHRQNPFTGKRLIYADFHDMLCVYDAIFFTLFLVHANSLSFKSTLSRATILTSYQPEILLKFIFTPNSSTALLTNPP